MEQRYTNESSAQSSTVSTYFNADEAPSGKYLNQAEMTKQPSKAKPSFFLAEAFEIEGQGQRYRVSPFVSAEQAKAIEAQSGIVLKTEGGKISGFLGGGAYGRVYVAEMVGTGQFCAVKIITGKLHESVHESEIQLKLTQGIDASQSRLLPLLDAVKGYEGEKLTRLYYILPLAALGSVADLQKQLPTLENVELKRLLSGHIAKGLLLGLWQMHRLKIYHLDVKLANLLINLEGKILVADFGTSEQIEGGNSLLTPYKSPEGRFIGNGDSTYFPPERSFEAETFDAAKADSYSAGAALWELVTGKSFEDGEEALKHAALQNPAPNSLADLAKRLLAPNPAERWTVEQALNHPVFQAPDLHDNETMAVVLDFLKRFVQQVQLKARDEKVSLSLNELSQSQTTQTSSALENKLKTLQAPFEKRPDIQEQLKLYLPLQGSFAREVKDPEKDCFALVEKTQEFLTSNNTVLVLLADGGSGKSLFTQHLATELLKRANPNSNDKPWLPLYIALGGIQHPENLLQEGLGLTHGELKALEKNYQLLLIADGYDEQSQWINLYVQNQLHRYEMKVIITSRINALPPHYSPYFMPQVPGESRARGHQEIYVQPFNAKQIDSYIVTYVTHQQERLQIEVEANRLGKQWLEVSAYQNQVNNTLGLKELIQTPLLCRLSLEALPELAKRQNNSNSSSLSKITRAQVYEAFMTRWIEQQRFKHSQPPVLDRIFALSQRIALSLYQNNRAAQINIGMAQFQFDAKKGCYQQQAHVFDWFIQAKIERECLPLQEVQKGQYKFMHFSMQEFLLARHLYQQLMEAKSLKNLDWNQLKLTTEEKDHSILYFLGDFADTDLNFQQQLFQLIKQTKTDKSQARSGANAITILNAAGIQLNDKDFKGIAIPDANLSGMVSDGSDWSQADLSGVNLQSAWLRNSHFRQAQLRGIRFYEYPYIQEQNGIIVTYSAKHFFIVATGKEIKLYDAKTRQLLHTLHEHTEGVISLCVLGDGQTIASGSVDGTVRVWDGQQGQLLHTLQGHTDSVSSISVLGDGYTIVSGSLDNTIRVWDGKQGQLIHTLEGHTDEVISISVLGDGCTIVSGSNDRTVRMWDGKQGRLLHTLQGHTGGVGSISVLGDGYTIVSGSGDKTVRVWDGKQGRLLHTLQGHTWGVGSISVLGDGYTIVSGNLDNTVRVWDGRQGRLLHTLQGHTGSVNSIKVLADGHTIVSGSWDKTVRVWDGKQGQLLHTLQGHTSKVSSINVLGDGYTIVSCGGTTMRIWDGKRGQLLHTLQGHTDEVTSISVLGDGYTIVSGSQDKTLQVRDGKQGRLLHTLQGHIRRVSSLNALGDEQAIVSGSFDGTVRVWGGRQGQLLHTLQGHTAGVGSVSVLGDGRTIVSCGDYTVRIWDGKQGQLLHTLQGHTDLVSSISVLGDGYTIVSGSNDRTVRVWDGKQGQLLHTMEGHTREVGSISVLGDGYTIVSGSGDKTVRVWDGKQGRLLHTLQGHTDEVVSISVLGDGYTIVSGSNDRTVRVWDGRQGQLLHTLQGHMDEVTSVSRLGNRHTIVSGSNDCTVRVWDAKSGQCLQVISLPQAVKSLVSQHVQGEDRLIACFGLAVACFNLKPDFILSLQWLASGSTQLFLQGVDITDTRGLDETNEALFKQQGAIGKSEQKTKIEESLVLVDSNNNNLESAFIKPQPNVNKLQSLLFTQSKTPISQTALQQWMQSVASQGAWAVERNSQNLSIVFNPQQTKNFALMLTQLRSHLSQLPEWQKVVAHEQKDNTLLIRLQSEADAKDCEAKLKGVFGIEEYKFSESCVVS